METSEPCVYETILSKNNFTRQELVTASLLYFDLTPLALTQLHIGHKNEQEDVQAYKEMIRNIIAGGQLLEKILDSNLYPAAKKIVQYLGWDSLARAAILTNNKVLSYFNWTNDADLFSRVFRPSENLKYHIPTELYTMKEPRSTHRCFSDIVLKLDLKNYAQYNQGEDMLKLRLDLQGTYDWPVPVENLSYYEESQEDAHLVGEFHPFLHLVAYQSKKCEFRVDRFLDSSNPKFQASPCLYAENFSSQIRSKKRFAEEMKMRILGLSWSTKGTYLMVFYGADILIATRKKFFYEYDSTIDFQTTYFKRSVHKASVSQDWAFRKYIEIYKLETTSAGKPKSLKKLLWPRSSSNKENEDPSAPSVSTVASSNNLWLDDNSFIAPCLKKGKAGIYRVTLLDDSIDFRLIQKDYSSPHPGICSEIKHSERRNNRSRRLDLQNLKSVGCYAALRTPSIPHDEYMCFVSTCQDETRQPHDIVGIKEIKSEKIIELTGIPGRVISLQTNLENTVVVLYRSTHSYRHMTVQAESARFKDGDRTCFECPLHSLYKNATRENPLRITEENDKLRLCEITLITKPRRFHQKNATVASFVLDNWVSQCALLLAEDPRNSSCACSYNLRNFISCHVQMRFALVGCSKILQVTKNNCFITFGNDKSIKVENSRVPSPYYEKLPEILCRETHGHHIYQFEEEFLVSQIDRRAFGVFATNQISPHDRLQIIENAKSRLRNGILLNYPPLELTQENLFRKFEVNQQANDYAYEDDMENAVRLTDTRNSPDWPMELSDDANSDSAGSTPSPSLLSMEL